MVGRPSGERRLYVVVLAVVLLAIGLVVLWRRPATPVANVAVTNNPARLTYAQLYDAAWRQDQGRGNTTVTATLFTPPLVAALGADTQRSERDQQLYAFTKNLAPTELAIAVTIDSIAGYFTTEQILSSASVTDGAENGWTIKEWKPIIGGQQPVESEVTVSSLDGMLILATTSTIDWTSLKNLRLQIQNLGDQPIRQFVWAQPGLLADE